ncbi:SpoIIE family protein phosphatase [Streptomyces sp. NPDC048659]|uniref:SpoIIE family protein phosphatase n=1 Tax=Streptomyces sp. NPDC048659 TaxID=3155489 RepID=UPI00342BBABA
MSSRTGGSTRPRASSRRLPGRPPLPDGTTVLIQGDVAGHGTHAGLLALQIKSAVVAVLRLDPDPRAAAAAAWAIVAPEDERFTTLVISVLAPRGERLAWLNAGHEIVLLRRADGTVEDHDADWERDDITVLAAAVEEHDDRAPAARSAP